MSDEIKMDASHSYTGRMKVYEASRFLSTVRLESYELKYIVKMNAESISKHWQFDANELLIFRDVLNRWHQEEMVDKK